MPRHRSSAVPLSWLYTALIVYASLYPFAGWRVPGAVPFDFLLLGWPRWWTWFDLISNLLGYMPLGFLLFVAGRAQRRAAPVPSAVFACVGGTLLSLSMEFAAELPADAGRRRTSTSASTRSARCSASRLGAGVHWRGGIERWQRRARPLVRGAQRRRPGAAGPVADRACSFRCRSRWCRARCSTRFQEAMNPLSASRLQSYTLYCQNPTTFFSLFAITCSHSRFPYSYCQNPARFLPTWCGHVCAARF